MFIQTFSSLFIEADFYANQSYIAKNLCVNRYKPMMHCNGKCFLANKLNEQGKKESPASKTERSDISPFFVPATFALIPVHTPEKRKYFHKNEKVTSTFSPFIFTA